MPPPGPSLLPPSKSTVVSLLKQGSRSTTLFWTLLLRARFTDTYLVVGDGRALAFDGLSSQNLYFFPWILYILESVSQAEVWVTAMCHRFTCSYIFIAHN